MDTLRRKDIIEPDLSYRLVGVLFDVYDTIGPGHREHVYQKAIAQALAKHGIIFDEQVRVPLRYSGKQVGGYILDFVIEDRIILEIKSSHGFRKADYEQTKQYLVASKFPLAILARFTLEGVVFRRVLHPNDIRRFAGNS